MMKTLEAMMRSMRAGGVALLCALIGLGTAAGSAATVTAMAEPFRLSIRHDGIRPSSGDETLTYSGLWDGGDDATVTLAQEGVPLVEGLAGEGERAWSVARNGTYTLTHTTYTNGVEGKVETATFVVTGRDVPFGAADVSVGGYTGVYDGQPHGIGVTVAEGIVGVAKRYATNPGTAFTEEPPTLTDVGSMTVWCEISAPGYITQTNSATVTVTPRPVTLTSKSATKVYDGTPLTAHEVIVGGDGFVDGEGSTYTFTGSQTTVGESENTFTYTLNENTLAGNYVITTRNGTLTVTKASVGGEGGGDEPGGGDVPDGGLSKFDVAVVYDGEGHTIDTNALQAAFGAAMIGESAVEYAAGGSQFTATVSDAMNCVPPCFTNAGEYVVWYRVTNPNYEDFVHAAKVTITKRPVTLTSGTKTDFVYDGQPHACPHFIKSGQDFVEGEGIVASNWATVTEVAEGEVPNTFDYAPLDGTDLENYELTIVTGRIAVVAAPISVGPGGAVTVVGYTNVYDGAAHGVTVSTDGLLTTPTVQYRVGEVDAWADVSPMFGDVCDTQVWYRVTAPNYAPVVGTVGVRITPRPITLTAPTTSKTYDGTPLTFGAGDVTVGGDGYAPGEAFALSDFASITEAGKIDATYTVADGTARMDNYAIMRVAGTLTVTRRSVTLTSKSGAKVYDGTPLTAHEVAVGGDGFVGDEGATYTFTGSQTAVGTSENTFTYALNGNTAASNYEIATVNGTLTVTKANIGGGEGGGDEPGGGDVPDGGLSKFDASFVYDGEGHTVDTNALHAAFDAALIGESVVEYAAGGSQFTATVSDAMNCVPPCFTNAGEYVVWYRVTNPNYEDFVHAAKVTIAKHPVTLTSGTKLDFVYDGTAHTYPHIEVNGLGFVAGEGVTTSNWATVTTVAQGEVANTFDYAAQEGTDLGNYELTVVTGRIAVAAAPIPVGPGGAVTAVGYTNVYDGAAHGVTVSTDGLLTTPTVQYRVGEVDAWADVSPMFGDVCDTQVWYRVTAPNYAPVVGTVGVRITPRPITLTAPTTSKTYDGTPLTFGAGDVAIGGDGYAPGEAFAFSSFASITEAGKIDAGYTVADGTARMDNYAIMRVAGTLTVTRRAVSLTSKSDTKVYDGTPFTAHEVAVGGDGFVDGEGVTYAFTGSQTAVGTSENTFTYTLNENTSVGNYEITTVNGTLTVTKASIGGEGDDEPGGGNVPDGGLSKFDVAVVYDGEGHTVDTNALAVAFAAAMGVDETRVYYGYAAAGTAATGQGQVADWREIVPTYTNAGEYVVWYRVTNPNYEDFVHQAKVTITKRPVTLTSGTKTDFAYDGMVHTYPRIGVSGRGFVVGEGIIASNWATVTRVDEGEVANTFDYAAQEGTDLANYAITVVTGRIAVMAAPIPVGPGGAITAVGYTNIYDGAAHGVTVSANGLPTTPTVQYRAGEAGEWVDASPTFSDVCDTQVWYRVSAPNYTPVVGAVGVSITPRPVTLVSKSDTKVYDGAPLTTHEVTVGGDGFVDGEGATYAFTGSQTVVGTSENIFTYILNGNTKAGNYEIDVVNGTLTVTKACIGGGEGGDDEPGDGNVPDGGLSKFDAVFVYDGEGHTIDTNALAVAFAAAMGVDKTRVCYGYAAAGTAATGQGQVADWREIVPTYTNAGEYVVWYRVTNPNYEDFVHQAKVTIAKRPVTLISGTRTDFVYDGVAHTYPHIGVSGLGFVAGEGVTTSNWATVTTVAEGEVPNTFDYAPLDGTDLANYAITVVTGKIAVVAAPIPVGPGGAITAVGYTNIYDGAAHGVTVSASGLLTVPTVQYRAGESDAWTDASPMFGGVCDTQVWYHVSAPNYAPVVGMVGIRITPRPVTLTSKSETKVYDGTPLTAHEVTVGGDGFVGSEGATYSFTGSQTAVGTSENIFTYVLNENTAAGNYEISTAFGTLTVTKVVIGGGGDEPGGGDVPDGGLSKFDATFVYDGEGHTIDTNALHAAFGAAMGGESVVEYVGGSQFTATVSDAMNCVPPCFTNAGEYVIWYRVTNPNYEDFVHAAKVTITKRPVTLTSGTKTDFVYDGAAHTNPYIEVSGLGFVAGEGVTTSNWATVIEVAEGEVANTFDYAPLDGTNLGNYELTVATGRIAVVAAPIPVGPGGAVTAIGYTNVYDGVAHGVAVSVAGLLTTPTVQYRAGEAGEWVDASPTFSDVCDTQVWYRVSAPNYAPVVGSVGVRIMPRPITLTAPTKSKTYDGTPLTFDAGDVVVGGDCYVPGETFSLSGFASIADVGKIDAGYTVADGTARMDNYAIMRVVGTLTVTRRSVSLTSKSGMKVYDGTPLTAHEVTIGGDGFVDDEGAVYAFTGSQTTVGTSENTFTYTLNENTSVGNYEITTVNGTLTVTKASIGGEGDDEPGGGNVPDGGLSKFDATFVYDGEGHTIDTNALQAAFGVAMIGESVVEYAAGGSQFTATVSDAMNCVPPCFTNAGEYVVWYRVTNPNYEDFVHQAKVTITKRPVTLTSGTKTDFVYDGQPHACPHFIKSGQDFVEGEGIVASNWATVTRVDEGEVANTFDYAPLDGTDLANYKITVVTGRIAVVKATVGPGGGAEPGDGNVPDGGLSKFDVAFVYDGEGHTIDTNALVAAFGTALIGESAVEYAAGGSQFTATVSDAMNCVPPCFTNAGEYVVWYRVTNPNYEDFVHAAKVTITKRPVTLASKSDTKVYDGTPLTAHEVAVGGDGFVGGEGVTYAFTGSQTVVGTSENIFTYILNGNTKAGNYEIDVVNGTLTVTKACIGGGEGGDDEPGDGNVPDGGLSKFDTTFVYDGEGHTIDTNALHAAFGTAMGGGEMRIGYGYTAAGAAATGQEQVADWRDVAPTYTNVGEYVVWYRVTNPNYEDFVHAAKVTITPRDIAKATIAPIPDVTFTGEPVTPIPVVTDQEPSIIGMSDYTVSYRDNDRPGTATVTLSGTGNYRGTKSTTFLIKPTPVLYAALSGTLAWKLNTGTGCYTAQLKLTCTNGFDQGISDLKFIYQDRRDGAKITSGLWDSSARAYRPTVSIDGTAYRFVDLDAARITGQDVTALYGVRDIAQAIGMVPSAECAIELFVGNLSSPISDIGYVVWKSNGTSCALPVSAAGGSQGLAVSETMLKAVRMAASAPLPGVPLSLSALNTSLALGVVVDPASSPYCRLTDFAVSATDLAGRIEVGKESGGTETKGALGTNACVVLLGAKNLADGFAELGRVSVDAGGTFRFALGDTNCHFFRIRIEIENVVE